MDKQSLLQNYQPATRSLDSLSQVELLLVVGPSGVGKTSIATSLGLPLVIGDTDRPKRPGEQDGVEYNFKTEEQMLDEISKGNYIQAVIDSGGDLKATHISGFPTSGMAVFTIISEEVDNIRQMPFKKTLTIFITPPSFEDWMDRMKAHSFDEAKLQKRLAEAKKSINFALHDEQTHFILNDNLADAITQVKNLIGGTTDEVRESTAKEAASQILDELSSNG